MFQFTLEMVSNLLHRTLWSVFWDNAQKNMSTQFRISDVYIQDLHVVSRHDVISLRRNGVS